jgi:hypothetical protein
MAVYRLGLAISVSGFGAATLMKPKIFSGGFPPQYLSA